MGFFDTLGSLFDSGGDPARLAQLRGGLLGAAQAISQPYGNIGGAFIGAGQGAQAGKDTFMKQQSDQYGLANQRLGMQQKLGQANFFRKQSGLPPLSLDDLMKGNMTGGTAAPIAPAIASAPQALVQDTSQGGSQPSPAAPPVAQAAQASQPAFHLPPGFDTPEQFQSFAAAFPEEAMKRMYPVKEFDKTPRQGINPSTGKPEEYVMDNFGNPKWLGIGAAPNPNQPFNTDGSPNAAYQAYERQKASAAQAPAWANVAIARQKEADAKSGIMSDATADFAADQILAGDKSPFQNLGRGQQGAQNIVKLRQVVTEKALARGLKGSDLAALNAEFAGLQAGERTLGTRTANVEMAASEAQNLIPIALDASKAVPRTQYPTLNKVILAAQQGTGDENVVRLGVAVNGLVNTYARAISPSGTPTVSDKDHAREILEKAWSNGQFAAGVDQMQKEIAAARKSPGTVRGEFRAAISGGQPGMASVPDAPNSPNVATPTNAKALKSMLPAKITGDADYAKLKSGSFYIGPDGKTRQKP